MASQYARTKYNVVPAREAPNDSTIKVPASSGRPVTLGGMLYRLATRFSALMTYKSQLGFLLVLTESYYLNDSADCNCSLCRLVVRYSSGVGVPGVGLFLLLRRVSAKLGLYCGS